MTEKNRRIFFTLVFTLVFYVAGASFIQSFVNYPTWHLIGPQNFHAYHNAMGSRIIPFMVVPWFVEIVLTFFLMRFRPKAVPLPAIILAQALNLIAIASTIFIQIPIQMQFGESGFSAEALDRLLETDAIRWLSLIAKVLIYIWAILRFVGSSAILPISNGILRPVQNETR